MKPGLLASLRYRLQSLRISIGQKMLDRAIADLRRGADRAEHIEERLRVLRQAL